MKKLLCTVSVLSAGLAISPIAQSMEVYNDEKNALNFSGNLSVYYLNAEEFDEVNDGFLALFLIISINLNMIGKR